MEHGPVAQMIAPEPLTRLYGVPMRWVSLEGEEGRAHGYRSRLHRKGSGMSVIFLHSGHADLPARVR